MERGEIWLVDLEPTTGSEQRGERRVVVLTTAAFNRMNHVPIVAPITIGGDFARMRGFAVSLSGLGLGTQGVVRCDQPRAMDLRARRGRRLQETIPAAVMDDILARIGSLFE